MFSRHDIPAPRIFGSVVTGDDRPGSDVDLLVEFDDRHDIVDLLTLEEELADLLTVRVDIIDARGDGAVLQHAISTAVAM